MAKSGLYTNIPASAWITINKRVAIILASAMGGEYYKPLRVLPNYRQLVTLCEQWKTTTFSQLGAFAGRLAAAADKNAHLIRTVCPAGAWQISHSDIPRLNTLVDQVSAEISSLSREALALQQQLDAFENAQFQADVAHGQSALNPEWEVLTLASNNDFALARGRWDTAVQQLTYLKSQLPHLAQPLLAEQHAATADQQLAARVQLAADLQAALKDWQMIAGLARGFETAVADHRRYLDGDDWAYQQPAIDPNRLYQLTNRLAGQSGVLDYDPQTFNSLGLCLGPAEGSCKAHYWRFERVGSGWYRLVNGFGNALTHGDKPRLAPADGRQAQTWRFVPAGDGWFRLASLAAPHDHALGVFKTNTTHQIVSHHEKKFLFIPISESVTTVSWTEHRLEATTMAASANDLTQQWRVGNAIGHDTRFAEQGYLVSQCTSGGANWAVTLDGTAVVVTPLRNTVFQKWTAVYERIVDHGVEFRGVAYVCRGMGIASGAVNAPLTAAPYQPGQLRFLWFTRVMQVDGGTFMNVMHPLVGTGQVWDIFGGCPSATRATVGAHGENGGQNQRWFTIVI
ncbi:MAG: hypothetical protein KC425_22070 [Anaerolineales bacterium]|nr:hypothetical protein [Anaerolineales bacterium]